MNRFSHQLTICFIGAFGVLVSLTNMGWSGTLNPPPEAVNGSTPVPTMKTLDQTLPTWSRQLPCPTQANCPRFQVLTRVVGGQVPQIDNWGVLDKETGLVWERSPLISGNAWGIARVLCIARGVGGRMGWRLPSISELTSLMVPGDPAGGLGLPAGHPFANVQSTNGYWSATLSALDSTNAWGVNFGTGIVGADPKTGSLLFWCVRGGMNADAY